MVDDADTSAEITEVISSSPVRQDSELTTGSADQDSNEDDGEMVIHDDVSNVSPFIGQCCHDVENCTLSTRVLCSTVCWQQCQVLT